MRYRGIIMQTLIHQPDAALLTHTTVIQLKDGNVGTRILLADINMLIIGSLYMYADDDGYYNDPTSVGGAFKWKHCGQ